MRYIHHILTFLILALFPSLCAKAATETKLVVTPASGDGKSINVSNNPVISFTNEKLIIESESFSQSLSDILTLTFQPEVSSESGSSIHVDVTEIPVVERVSYVNPVSKLQPVYIPFAVSLSSATITLESDSYAYTGSPIVPAYTVTLGGQVLTAGTDYTAACTNNVVPGTATLTITGCGSYSGTQTATYTITAVQTVTVSINGEPVSPTHVIASSDGTRAFFENDNGLISVSDIYATAGSTINLVVRPKNNLIISAADIQPAVAGDDPSDLAATREYQYVMPESGTVDFNFSFREKPQTVDIASATITLSGSAFVYNGKAFEPAIVVKQGEQTLTENTDYTVSYQNNVHAGTARVTITGSGNYSGTAGHDFTIRKAMLTVKGDDQAKVYGAEVTSLSCQITGFVNGEDAAVLSTLPMATTTADATSAVGEYPITVSGGAAQDYDFTYEQGTLTISKAMLTVKAKDAAMVYGEELPRLTFEISGLTDFDSSDNVLTKVPVVTSEATADSPAGTYPITVSGGEAKNYDFTYEEGTLTISKAMLTVKADAQTKVYGDELPALTCQLTGFVKGEDIQVLAVQPVATTEATATSPVGTYDIVAGGGEAANYEFAYENAVLTVTPRSITGATLTMDASEYPFKGEAVVPVVTVQDGTATLSEGADYTVAVTDNTAPGTGKLTVMGQGNYQDQIDTTFVISLEPSVAVFINDSAVVDPVLDGAKAEFVTRYGKVFVDDYYALPGEKVILGAAPEKGWMLEAEHIQVSVPVIDLSQLPYVYAATYDVPTDGLVTVRIRFTEDSVYLGINDRLAEAFTFEVVDGQTVRVLGARETAPVSIFDGRGQQVSAEVVRSDRELLIRLNRQPQGLYIIKVNNKTFKVYRK